MTKFIIRRVIQALPVIWLITVVSFLLMQQAPGGPQAAFNQNPHITPEQVTAWLQRWCLVRDADILQTIQEYLGWLGVYNCTGRRLPLLAGPAELPARVPRRRRPTACSTATSASRSRPASRSST